MALLPQGGTYISWFSGSPSGYDVRLQRLDAAGNILWDETGLLVAQRGFSSTEDYGLDTDEGGNALLAFRDDRSGVESITAVKITPDGEFPWGANGINVSEGFDFINAPKIAAMPNGGAVVAFTGDGQSVIKGLGPDGSVLWQDIQTADVFLAISDTKRSTNADGHSIYAVLFRTLGPPTVPGRLSA
ncbi:MAG: hypothetical protein LAT84_03190 [Balneolia bacterium]|nr:hypothetical protein [Balneolia bacterium]